MAAEKLLQNLGRLATGAGFATLVGTQCIFNVDGGEQAVMFNRFATPFNAGGVSDRKYGEGTHFMVPWLQTPTIYSVRTRPKDIQTTTGTKDMQQITLWVRLLFKPRPDKLPFIHSSLGAQYDNHVLPSVGQEVMKSVVAQYDAEQLLTLRGEVSREIRTQITERCAAFDILLDDVAITHLTFSKEYAKAIEEKQIAEQEAQRQSFNVAKAEQEMLANIKLAEGEAEAAQMMSKVFEKSGTAMLEVKRIIAARDIAETLANANNVMYLPGGAGAQSPTVLLNAGQV